MDLEAKGVEQTRQSRHTIPAACIDLSNVSGAVHFIGIGGIGMSALARLLLAKGFTVSGSDRSQSTTTDELSELGARISIGHQGANVADAAAIVVSTAIESENPELAYARSLNLPVWHRSQLLAALTGGYSLIAVSGTHGKTTTTGMVAQVLLDSGLDPTVVVGGVFPRIGSNAFLGAGDYFVAEIDESDGSHLGLISAVAVVTNIEADHLENYPGGLEQIRDYMVAFANKSRLCTVLCADDAGCRMIRPRLTGQVVTYGRSRAYGADYHYESLPGFGMKVFKADYLIGEITLNVPGEHNKQNALAALVVGLELGLSFEQVKAALETFSAVARRFQILGQESGVIVVDDYAHHPTEVAATLGAAQQYLQCQKAGQGRVVAVFQPHQPGRLKDLWEEFCAAFCLSDLVLIGDIYIARGKPIEGIDALKFSQAVRHDNVHYLPGAISQLPQAVLPYLSPGDLVLTIGAGDITRVGWEILRLLKQG